MNKKKKSSNFLKRRLSHTSLEWFINVLIIGCIGNLLTTIFSISYIKNHFINNYHIVNMIRSSSYEALILMIIILIIITLISNIKK